MHKLLLQPLWKTASDTGCMAAKEPLLIITGELENGMLRVKIEDNGKGMPEETVTILNQPDYHREDHFGIENVRKGCGSITGGRQRSL